MKLIDLPGWGWAAPKDKEVAQFLARVRERPRKKIFIHFWLAAIASVYSSLRIRITFDAWTPRNTPYRKCVPSTATSFGILI
jgi:hypothetical protein